jgi:predicted RNA-binding Zn-ribbon protein involved in translation (DUF1610 family)
MPEEVPRIACPGCGRAIPVDETWRMVECPFCHRVISRMDDDARFD